MPMSSHRPPNRFAAVATGAITGDGATTPKVSTLDFDKPSASAADVPISLTRPMAKPRLSGSLDYFGGPDALAFSCLMPDSPWRFERKSGGLMALGRRIPRLPKCTVTGHDADI